MATLWKEFSIEKVDELINTKNYARARIKLNDKLCLTLVEDKSNTNNPDRFWFATIYNDIIIPTKLDNYLTQWYRHNNKEYYFTWQNKKTADIVLADLNHKIKNSER